MNLLYALYQCEQYGAQPAGTDDDGKEIFQDMYAMVEDWLIDIDTLSHYSK